MGVYNNLSGGYCEVGGRRVSEGREECRELEFEDCEETVPGRATVF